MEGRSRILSEGNAYDVRIISPSYNSPFFSIHSVIKLPNPCDEQHSRRGFNERGGLFAVGDQQSGKKKETRVFSNRINLLPPYSYL